MKTLCFFLISAVILSPLTSSQAAPETFADFKAIYDAEMAKIAKGYLADIGSVQQAYTDYLGSDMKKAVNAGDLKTYEKDEQEKKRFEKEMTIPADSPFQKSVAQAETKRIAAINDLSVRYVYALKTHQVSLMKAEKIDGAKEVQREIDSVQAVIAEIAPKLPSAIPKKDIAVGLSSNKVSLTKPAAIKVNWDNNTELRVGNPAHNFRMSRPILITETPKELKGYFFTQLARQRDKKVVEFEVTADGIVYCFGLEGPVDGWKETGWAVGLAYDSNVTKYVVYSKALIKGNYRVADGAWLIFPKN
jgi:hypothetical protein